MHIEYAISGSIYKWRLGGSGMGLFKQLLETAGEKITKDKGQREQEEAFVNNNEGSKAICAYFVNLFEKGNPGYDWVKENHVGLFPVVNKDSVSLCYMQMGDGKSYSGVKPKDIEVVKYSFQEMYSWYGLSENCGYRVLTSRTQLNALENMIYIEVNKLSHIKYNNGFLVKLFQ